MPVNFEVISSIAILQNRSQLELYLPKKTMTTKNYFRTGH